MTKRTKWLLGCAVAGIGIPAAVLIWLFIGIQQTEQLSPASQALNRAILDSDMAAARASLAAGADVNNVVLGLSPLYHATRHGQVDIAELLLDHGAAIDFRNGPARRTALHEAVLRGDWSCMALLIERGADINARNTHNRTPLYYAVSPPPPLSLPPDHERIAEYLRAHGAEL